MADVYTALLEGQLARLFGMLDRAQGSPTYGCLDRAYWHLKIASDFPGATWQQPALALAWLAEDGGAPGEGVSAAQAAAWARAAMLFWTRIQNRDGSFNEWYEQEHSYCPTAFTTFAVSEALLLLRGHMPAAETATVTAAVTRAAEWLVPRHNTWVENQNLAAVNALHNAAALTGRGDLRAAADAKLARVLAAQDAEGWLPEYGGGDPGYALLSIDLLAHSWAKTEDRRAADALDRLVRFVDTLVMPDGSVADVGSRATQHALPYGLELMAHRHHAGAARLLARLHAGARAGRAVSPARLDDRYFAYFYINSYVGASRACRGEHAGAAGRPAPESVLPGAGVAVFSNGSRTVLVAGKRNGMVRVFREDTLLYADAGYHAQLADGTWGWTSGFDPGQEWTVNRGTATEVVTRGRFYKGGSVARLVAPFRALSGVALRSGAVADRVHAWLKRREVASARRLPLTLERTVRLEEHAVVVTDRLRVEGGAAVRALMPVEEGRVPHSPSAGFYDGLAGARLRKQVDGEAVAHALARQGQVTVRTVVPTGTPSALEVSWE